MSPFQIANYFSFLIIPLLFFLLVAAILRWRRASRWLWAGWVAALLVYGAFLLSGQSTTARYDTPENIRRSLAAADEPTLVEFFSNY